jgi:hypothetical protein
MKTKISLFVLYLDYDSNWLNSNLQVIVARCNKRLVVFN